MATITEDYVSFETAKLLKGKGFDEVCDKKYFGDDCSGPSYIRDSWEDGGNVCPMSNSDLDDGSKYADISAPTLQMAIKWLRKVHHLHIELNWEKGNQLYSFQIWKPGKFQPEISSLDLWRIYKDDNYIGEWNYEEASEAAIKYCLEHLI